MSQASLHAALIAALDNLPHFIGRIASASGSSETIWSTSLLVDLVSECSKCRCNLINTDLSLLKVAVQDIHAGHDLVNE